MSTHWYKDGQLCAEGEGYPSVSTILAVRANPGVYAWRERVGVEYAEVYTKSKQNLGTKVHADLEYLIRFAKLTSAGMLLHEKLEPSSSELYVRGFVAWFNKTVPTNLQAELYLQSTLHEYAGTADLVCQIDGEPWIVDFKTGRMDHSHALQLAAYAEAYREMTGIRCRRAVLQLTTEIKRGYRWKEYTDEDDFGVFMCHKGIFDWLELKNPRKKKEETIYEEIMS